MIIEKTVNQKGNGDLIVNRYEASPTGNVQNKHGDLGSISNNEYNDGVTHESGISKGLSMNDIMKEEISMQESILDNNQRGEGKKKIMKKKGVKRRVVTKGSSHSTESKKDPSLISMMPLKPTGNVSAPKATSLDMLGKMLAEAQRKRDKENSENKTKKEKYDNKNVGLKMPKFENKLSENITKKKTPGYAVGYPNISAQDAFGPAIINCICSALVASILSLTTKELENNMKNHQSEYAIGKATPLIRLLQALGSKPRNTTNQINKGNVYFVDLINGMEESGKKLGHTDASRESKKFNCMSKLVLCLKQIMGWHKNYPFAGAVNNEENNSNNKISDIARISSRILALWLSLHLTNYAAMMSDRGDSLRKNSDGTPSILDIVNMNVNEEKVVVETGTLENGMKDLKAITVSLAATFGIGVTGLEIILEAFGLSRMNMIEGKSVNNILTDVSEQSYLPLFSPFVRNCALTIAEGVILNADPSNRLKPEIFTKQHLSKQKGKNDEVVGVETRTGITEVAFVRKYSKSQQPENDTINKNSFLLSSEWQLPVFLTQLLSLGKTPLYKEPFYLAPSDISSLLFNNYASSILSADPPTATRMSILGGSPRKVDTKGTSIVLNKKNTSLLHQQQEGITNFIANIGDICVIGTELPKNDKFEPTIVNIPMAQCVSSSMRLYFYPETSRTMTLETKEWSSKDRTLNNNNNKNSSTNTVMDGDFGVDIPWEDGGNDDADNFSIENCTFARRKTKTADKSAQRLQRLRYMNSLRSDFKSCFDRTVELMGASGISEQAEREKERERKNGITFLPLQISSRRIVDFMTNVHIPNDKEQPEGRAQRLAATALKEDLALVETERLARDDKLLLDNVIDNALKRDKNSTHGVLLGGRRVDSMERALALVDAAVFECWE